MELITVTKGDETSQIHPSTLHAHEVAGWTLAAGDASPADEAPAEDAEQAAAAPEAEALAAAADDELAAS